MRTLEHRDLNVTEARNLIDAFNELLRRYRALEAAARPVLALADVAANSGARSTAREREELRALLEEGAA